MEYMDEYITPITRGDWHNMLVEDPSMMPNADLSQWMHDEEMVDLGYDCIIRPYYVDRCYSIQYNSEEYNDIWGWSCSVWFESEGRGLFEDMRAIKCETPEEALQALFDSLASCA